MTQTQGQPGEQDRESGQIEISATDRGVAAFHIGQVSTHLHVDGVAGLRDFLQRNQVVSTTTGDPASDIRRQLSQQSPDISLHGTVTEQLGRLRGLPEFALGDYNNYDRDHAQTLSDRVVEATRIPVAVVAVLAFWGDPGADRWWMPDLQRLARVTRRGGSAWLINLPLVAALMLFYAAGVAAVCAENYGRVAKLLALYGEPIDIAGPVPLPRMLAPNPSAIKLTPAQNYQAVSPTVVEALHLGSDALDDAWQLFEILRLASELMGRSQFDAALAKYTAANRRRDATASLDQTARLQAEATKNGILDDLAGCSPARGLHLLAADKVYSPGTSFRWGNPTAERVAAEVSRDGNQHPIVRGLSISADRIELALRAVSRAVGAAAVAHPANWVSGAVPDEIWLDG